MTQPAAIRAARVRVVRLAVALAAATVLVGASSAAANAAISPTTPVTPGSTYLALGDSVTFGYQEPTVVPAPNYHNAASFPGYPEQMGAALGLNVANAACSGETSASFINAKAQSNGCENTFPANSGIAYRKNFPLHVRYNGSQLAFAVSFLRRHRGVRLVSLMIGANDVFLCQKMTTDGCLSAPEQRAVFSKISANVRIILSAIRGRAGYTGQLAIVHYYSLDYTSALFSNVSLGLNRAMDSAAKPFHVEMADGYGAFKLASVHSGDKPCTAGLLTQLGTPTKCGVHPSYAGQALLAVALEKAIRFF